MYIVIIIKKDGYLLMGIVCVWGSHGVGGLRNDKFNNVLDYQNKIKSVRNRL